MPDSDRLDRTEKKLDILLDRTARIEEAQTNFRQDQSKKNEVLFDLMNEKVIPTVQIAKDIKERLAEHEKNEHIHTSQEGKEKLDSHIRGHSGWVSMVGTVVAILVGCSSLVIAIRKGG